MPITEDHPQNPISPYGFTKLVIEQALADYSHAYGLGYAALRYFNASGAAADGTIGEDHDPETHLIPLILQVALGQREYVEVFGTDYPTPDGTCIRDYIHVDDLATAHVAALEKLQPGMELKLNLGTGHGASVQEVIDLCREVTGHPITVRTVGRREGDPPATRRRRLSRETRTGLASPLLDARNHRKRLGTGTRSTRAGTANDAAQVLFTLPLQVPTDRPSASETAAASALAQQAFRDVPHHPPDCGFRPDPSPNRTTQTAAGARRH